MSLSRLTLDGSSRTSFRKIAMYAFLGLGVSVTDAVCQTELERVFGTPLAVAARRDSLEHVATTAADRLERSVAIRRLAAPGRGWYFLARAVDPPPEITYPGIVASLERIYRTVGRLEREAVVGSLAHQAERTEAIRLLTEVAQSREMGLDLPLAPLAVSALSRMGDQGATALRALHSAGGDSLPLIRRQLEELSRTGYRRPPGG